MSRVSRGLKAKKGDRLAQEMPGVGPRGRHVQIDAKKHPDAVCNCGGCSGRRKAVAA